MHLSYICQLHGALLLPAAAVGAGHTGGQTCRTGEVDMDESIGHAIYNNNINNIYRSVRVPRLTCSTASTTAASVLKSMSDESAARDFGGQR